MFKLMDERIILILHSKILLIWTFVHDHCFRDGDGPVEPAKAAAKKTTPIKKEGGVKEESG